MTKLAHKPETLAGTIGIAAMSTSRAGEATVVGIYLNGHAPGTQGLVGEHGMQLGKAPFGVGGIGMSLLLTRSLAARSFADIRQVLLADQAVGETTHDACRDSMIGVG